MSSESVHENRPAMKRSARGLVNSARFNAFVICMIVVASMITGLLTYPSILGFAGPLLRLLDLLILWFFVAELALRAWVEPGGWRVYLRSGWNAFDAAIILISVLPLHSETAAVFRLIRVLRTLRLLKTVPGLQIIIAAMMKSVSSLGYIGIVLLIHLYIYAVVGAKLFATSDPAHFANLQRAFLTLFQVVTLEGWVDVMQMSMTHPSVHPLVAPAYFVSFILLGTMIIMNLVIGVIMNSMMEAKREGEYTQRGAGAATVRLQSIEARLDEVREELVALRQGLKEPESGNC